MKKAKDGRALRKMLKLWERLELKFTNEDNTANFVTRIEDFDKNLLIIENPVRIAGNLNLKAGDQVEAVFNRHDASYSFAAVIVSVDEQRENIMTLKTLTGIKRTQRRRFVRIDIAGEVTFKVIEIQDDGELDVSLDKKGQLLNISAGGILLNTQTALRHDNLILLNLNLKNSQRLENVLGMVKRSEQSNEPGDGQEEYLTGIEFITKEQAAGKLAVNIDEELSFTVNFFDEALQRAIVQFVYRQQIESRKQEKVKS